MDIGKEKKVERFFEACMKEWERKHGRRPESRDEMWDAIIDGMDRSSPGKPKNGDFSRRERTKRQKRQISGENRTKCTKTAKKSFATRKKNSIPMNKIQRY